MGVCGSAPRFTYTNFPLQTLQYYVISIWRKNHIIVLPKISKAASRDNLLLLPNLHEFFLFKPFNTYCMPFQSFQFGGKIIEYVVLSLSKAASRGNLRPNLHEFSFPNPSISRQSLSHAIVPTLYRKLHFMGICAQIFQKKRHTCF